MFDKEIEKVGDAVLDLIDSAVDSRNYSKLNEAVSQTLQSFIDSGSDAVKKMMENRTDEDYKKYRYKVPQNFRDNTKLKQKTREQVQRELFEGVTDERVKGILLIVAGLAVSVGSAIWLILGGILSSISGAGISASILPLIFLAAGIGLTAYGNSVSKKAGRFLKYIKAIGEKAYAGFDSLAKAVGKSVDFVKKDVADMLKKGWFKQGHVDGNETTLIASDEVYKLYEEAEVSRAVREEEERKNPALSPEVQEVLKKGNEYLHQIHQCNEEIPGEEISAKIARIEDILDKILTRTKEHPEVVVDLGKMMNYYLPMTVKLLNAYADMDRQPVQGENIRRSKQEIEETLDTLNTAFEKLFDSVYADEALDISTDISVLKTLLAQEGLQEDGITALRH